MSRKGEIDIFLKADELGVSLERLSEEVISDLQDAVKDAAYGAYAKIVATAQEKLHSTRQDYLKGLSINQIGEGSYLISLDGSFPNAIEVGMPPKDLKSAMLGSTKSVAVGSRAGLPWVQKGKDGQKFAHVPMQKNPKSATPKGRDMAEALKSLKAYNKRGRKQKITSTFKDAFGNPMQGKVAVAKDTGVKNLENLVKYQKVTTTKTGKKRVDSAYVVYRTVSEDGKPWMHPGMKPLNAFEEAEKWLDAEIANILKVFAGE